MAGSAGSPMPPTRPRGTLWSMITTIVHLEIEAPDGGAALDLERRLAHLEPTTVCRHGCWFVELAVELDESLSEIQGVVAGWLRAIGHPATTIRVDGRAQRLEAEARPPFGRAHRATNASFIG